MTKTNTITLTDKELDAVLWALSVTADSFDGWSSEEKGPEVIQDLKAIARAESKIYKASNARAELMAELGITA